MCIRDRASGAFHQSKPSDLLPELQGRLPVRVILNALKKDDFIKILKETDMICFNCAVFRTDNCTLNKRQ